MNRYEKFLLAFLSMVIALIAVISVREIKSFVSDWSDEQQRIKSCIVERIKEDNVELLCEALEGYRSGLKK